MDLQSSTCPTGSTYIYLWYGMEESNHHSHFRRVLSYPLNECRIGADEGTRTPRLWILSSLPIPIRLHPQYLGTPSEIRTHNISPFERDDFPNLSIGAYGGDTDIRICYLMIRNHLRSSQTLVGWKRIELLLDRLWVDCFTIKLSAQYWWKIRESNPVTHFHESTD